MKKYLAMAVVGVSTASMLAGPAVMTVHAEEVDDQTPAIEQRDGKRRHFKRFKRGRHFDKEHRQDWKDLRERLKNVDPALLPEIQRAVEVRETSKIEAYKAKSAAKIEAMETKKDGLVTAWGIEDPEERHEALKETHQEYRETKRALRTRFHEAVKSAYQTFLETLKGILA